MTKDNASTSVAGEDSDEDLASDEAEEPATERVVVKRPRTRAGVIETSATTPPERS